MTTLTLPFRASGHQLGRVHEFTRHTGELSFNEDAPGTVIYAGIRRIP